MKIVINSCFGGFGVSVGAVKRGRELGHEWAKWPRAVIPGERYSEDTETVMKDYGQGDSASACITDDDDWEDKKLRCDLEFISVIEEMGEKANGSCAALCIVEIPDEDPPIKWHIEEYDGREHVAEDHRRW